MLNHFDTNCFLLGILYGIFVLVDLISYNYLATNDNSKLFVVAFVMCYILALITVIPKLVKKYEQYKESKNEHSEAEKQIQLNVETTFYDDVHCSIGEIASTFKKQSEKSKGIFINIFCLCNYIYAL